MGMATGTMWVPGRARDPGIVCAASVSDDRHGVQAGGDQVVGHLLDELMNCLEKGLESVVGVGIKGGVEDAQELNQVAGPLDIAQAGEVVPLQESDAAGGDPSVGPVLVQLNEVRRGVSRV